MDPNSIHSIKVLCTFVNGHGHAWTDKECPFVGTCEFGGRCAVFFIFTIGKRGTSDISKMGRFVRKSLHILCSDGCFYGEGMFRVAPRVTSKTLGLWDVHLFGAHRHHPWFERET